SEARVIRRAIYPRAALGQAQEDRRRRGTNRGRARRPAANGEKLRLIRNIVGLEMIDAKTKARGVAEIGSDAAVTTEGGEFQSGSGAIVISLHQCDMSAVPSAAHHRKRRVVESERRQVARKQHRRGDRDSG